MDGILIAEEKIHQAKRQCMMNILIKVALRNKGHKVGMTWPKLILRCALMTALTNRLSDSSMN